MSTLRGSTTGFRVHGHYEIPTRDQTKVLDMAPNGSSHSVWKRRCQTTAETIAGTYFQLKADEWIPCKQFSLNKIIKEEFRLVEKSLLAENQDVILPLPIAVE